MPELEQAELDGRVTKRIRLRGGIKSSRVIVLAFVGIDEGRGEVKGGLRRGGAGDESARLGKIRVTERRAHLPHEVVLLRGNGRDAQRHRGDEERAEEGTSKSHAEGALLYDAGRAGAAYVDRAIDRRIRVSNRMRAHSAMPNATIMIGPETRAPNSIAAPTSWPTTAM